MVSQSPLPFSFWSSIPFFVLRINRSSSSMVAPPYPFSKILADLTIFCKMYGNLMVEILAKENPNENSN